jgi:branched-chain amino acid aminotransferase
MMYLYAQGEFLLADQAVIKASHRGLRFADGFFETIRVYNGKPLFLEHHFSRVLDALKAYHIERDVNFTLQRLEREIDALLQRNQIAEGGRVRITFSRAGDGFYLPTSNALEYMIEARPLEINRFVLNEEGKVTELYPEMKKDINRLSAFKNIDSNLYVLGSIYAQEHKLHDVLIQNYRGGIIESTTSNLFLVSNGVLYTPGLEDGPIAGIVRMQVINLALEHGIKIYECNINPQNLLAADELFLTNAIHGVQWVGSYRTKRYYNVMGHRITALLNDYATKLTS